MTATATSTKIPTKILRKDPAPRHVDGMKGRANLIGADPDKHYVYAYKAHSSGQPYYESLGYEIECMPLEGGDGVRPRRGCNSKPGEPIEESGHVLMSISREKHQEIFQHGNEDSGGQDWVDATEKKIVNREHGAGFDGLRGMQTKYAYIAENSITPAMPETD